MLRTTLGELLRQEYDGSSMVAVFRAQTLIAMGMRTAPAANMLWRCSNCPAALSMMLAGTGQHIQCPAGTTVPVMMHATIFSSPALAGEREWSRAVSR